MAELHELQSDVMRSLLACDDEAARHVVPGALAPERRLDVYRNNLYENLSSALAAVYPTVTELVGDDFFRFAARRYIRSHPPRTGNLHDFGGELAVFLADFEPVAGLPYLPDVARLEWAWHVVFHRESMPAVDASLAFDYVAALPEESRGRVGFGWQPAAELVRSEYPVVTLWEWHQQPADERGEIDLGLGPEAALVRQSEGQVWVHRLSAGEYSILASLANGEPLESAAQRAIEVEASLDIAGVLARHLALGVLLEPHI